MNKRIRKKKMKQENRRLVQEYPFLLPRNVWTDKVPNDYDYTYTLADNISRGWRKAFGKQLFDELKEDLVRNNYLEEFRFQQIKEKFGGLRLYCGAIPMNSQADKILDKYERMSETVCEHCGKPDQEIKLYNGWLMCLCPDCQKRMEERQKRMREKYRKDTEKYKK